MTKQTKKLSAQPTVTTVNSGQKLPMVDGSGKFTVTSDGVLTATNAINDYENKF